MFLDCLALVAGGEGTCILGSDRLARLANSWKDGFWQATAPRAPQRQQTKGHLWSFNEIGLFRRPEASA